MEQPLVLLAKSCFRPVHLGTGKLVTFLLVLVKVQVGLLVMSLLHPEAVLRRQVEISTLLVDMEYLPAVVVFR